MLAAVHVRILVVLLDLILVAVVDNFLVAGCTLLLDPAPGQLKYNEELKSI